MKCKKDPVDKKIKPCPSEDNKKPDVLNPRSLERDKYDAGHRMRLRDRDGRTKHRDYDGEGNHKPH